jgi:multiple sugar transport system substrate-binding protein
MGKILGRRRFLLAGTGLVATSLLAACGQAAPSPTAPPAKPAEAPKPAAAEPTKPPAAAPTPTAAAEPTKPAAEPTKPAAEPTKPAVEPTKPAVAAAPAAAGAKGGKWAGKTFRYAGLSSMGSMVEQYAKPWFEQTGAKIERGEFGQQEMEDKVMQSVATNTHLADVIQFNSNSSGDVMGAGYLLEVPPEVKTAVEWDDVLPIFRERILSWKGKVYALPYDGDTHNMAFRRDLFLDADNQTKFKAKFGYDLDPENGPKDWVEHRNVSEFFTGWDWNKDGKIEEAGFAHMTKRKDTGWWGFHSRAGAYAKHPDDTGYFFDLDSFEPRINNPAFVRALTEWKEECEKWAPKGILGYGWGEVLEAYASARAAMCIGWGDHGTIAQDTTRSVIKGKSGYGLNPGSKEVYNAKAKKWDKQNTISYAPFVAFGGWVIAVPKTTKQPDLAWDFASFVSSKETSLKMVTAPTGVNPLRYSHFDTKPWVNSTFKWEEAEAKRYLDAIKRTLEHPNIIMDLRIPGWVQYRDALELAISKGLAGEAAPQAAMDEAGEAWKQVTQRMGGAGKQKDIYAAAVGK